MEVVEWEDVEEIIDHYWREYAKPKEVRDVLEDIVKDLRSVMYDRPDEHEQE